ncbi:C2H2-like zinc finger protein [Zea mays]|nr:C2H2-like zinc finger protein [Zea mays]
MPFPPVAVKEMSREARKTKSRSSPSPSSWLDRSMKFYYPSSTSRKSRAQAAPAAATEGKSTDGGDKPSNGSSGKKKKKKKRSISIGRSMACGSSICSTSTKESSVMSRDSSSGASSRSLRSPNVDAVYASAAAAISATSSFSSVTTTAATTVTSSTSSSSPLSSALSSPLSSIGRSFRGVQIRRLSGCYECRHSVFDPSGFAASFPCADCDEVFSKPESLELHRATRHAVSELAPEDTSRNVVEIIFQSSWLRKQTPPVCRIERVLKVQSSDRTVKRFEQYRESVRERARSDDQGQGKKNPRCVADGNELLRFHCATFTCSLGLAGSTALCRAPSAQCMLCSIIKEGFR